MIYCWVTTYSTESGDRGILGVWESKPKPAHIRAILKQEHPEDYRAKTIDTETTGEALRDPADPF